MIRKPVLLCMLIGFAYSVVASYAVDLRGVRNVTVLPSYLYAGQILGVEENHFWQRGEYVVAYELYSRGKGSASRQPDNYCRIKVVNKGKIVETYRRNSVAAQQSYFGSSEFLVENPSLAA